MGQGAIVIALAARRGKRIALRAGSTAKDRQEYKELRKNQLIFTKMMKLT